MRILDKINKFKPILQQLKFSEEEIDDLSYNSIINILRIIYYNPTFFNNKPTFVDDGTLEEIRTILVQDNLERWSDEWMVSIENI